MTEDGAPLQPEEIAVPFRPRGTYAGYKAFGSGDGAVLVEPGVGHELRRAAEFATQEGRVTGGLLYGRGWADDQGTYLVVSGFIEGGPGENSGDRPAADGTDEFALSESDLRLLREDAARMYSASYELGWWRTLAALGDFGPGDFATQAELVGPDGVGLLVYGTGPHWGTAYLGPEGRAPDSAGTLVATPGAAPGPAHQPQAAYEPAPGYEPGAAYEPGAVYPTEPGYEPEAEYEPEAAYEPEATFDRGPEVINLAAGESLLDDDPLPPPDAVPPVYADEPLVSAAAGGTVTPGAAPGTAAPGTVPGRDGRRRGNTVPGRTRQRVTSAAGRTRQRVTSRVRATPRARGWAARPAGAASPGPELPADVQLVVGALAIVVVAAAIIIGVLVHSVIVAVIIAVIGLLAITSTVWMSRR